MDQHGGDDNCVQRASGSVFMTQEEATKACCACNSCHRCPLSAPKKGSSTAFFTLAAPDSSHTYGCNHEPRIAVYSGLDEECLSPASPDSALNVIGPLPLSYQGSPGFSTKCFNTAAIGDRYGLTYYLLGVVSFLSLCGSVAMGGESLQLVLKEWASQLLFGVSAVAFAPVGYSLLKDTMSGFSLSAPNSLTGTGLISRISNGSTSKRLASNKTGTLSQSSPTQEVPIMEENESDATHRGSQEMSHQLSPHASTESKSSSYSRPAHEDASMPSQTDTDSNTSPIDNGSSFQGLPSPQAIYTEELQNGNYNYAANELTSSSHEEINSGPLIAVGLFMLLLGTGVAGGLYLKWRQQEVIPIYKRPSAIAGTSLLVAITLYSLLRNPDTPPKVKGKRTKAKI
jgi:hypothetical protein